MTTIATVPLRFLFAAALGLAVLAAVPFAANANVGDGTCFGTGDKAAGECEVGGGGGGGPTVYIPMGGLDVSPTTINQGESALLSWACYELAGQDQYVGYTSNFGASSRNGTMSVSPSQTTTYEFTCYSSTGSSNPYSATLTVNAAYADVYAGATSPSSATVGTAVTFSSTVANQGNATATNFPNSFQISGIGYVAAQTHTLGAGGSTGISANYTFSTAGSYQVRACADMNTSGSGVLSEPNETNCGGWTTVVVAPLLADVAASQLGIIQITGGLGALLQAIISNTGPGATNQ